jgi:DNA repair exonuclease SbcCD nuclease subunit
VLRLLHLADAHLDTAFEGRTDRLRRRLREALRTAFERAVDQAIAAPVDVVLIAGDLFDDERLSFATEAFLLEQCERLHEASIPVVYATGNHDPGGQGFRAASIDWPDSFRYVDAPEPEIIDLTDAQGTLAARVIAAGHATAREDRNLAATFPPRTDARVPHIGMLHAHVTQSSQVERHDRYAPCGIDDLRAAGYDYWALGHIHQRQEVDGESHAWYAGNIQGRSPRETGAKGALLVDIEAGRAPRVTPIPLAPVRWETVVLDDLADTATVRQLTAQARQALNAKLATDDSSPVAMRDVILRVELHGASPLADTLTESDAVAELEAVLGDQLGVLDAEIKRRNLTPPIDVETYRGETHLAGEVLELLEHAMNDDAVLENVSPEVWALFQDEPSAAAVRQLLAGLDREAIARLIQSEDER